MWAGMEPSVTNNNDDRSDPRSIAIDLYAELSSRQHCANLANGLRAFLDLTWADMWVGNGGFIGLWPTSAATIRRLPAAADYVGAAAFAALFRDANRSLPAGTLD